jgi:HEAT repeat protein
VRAAFLLPDREAAPIIEKLGVYPWPDVRQAMVGGLRAAKPDRRTAALRAMRSVQAAAADGEAVELVSRLLEDPNPQVQLAAIETLGALRADESVTMLVELHEIVEPQAQLVIRSTLERIGTTNASRAAQQLRIRPFGPICRGDQGDLSELLADDCVGLFQNTEF